MGLRLSVPKTLHHWRSWSDPSSKNKPEATGKKHTQKRIDVAKSSQIPARSRGGSQRLHRADSRIGRLKRRRTNRKNNASRLPDPFPVSLQWVIEWLGLDRTNRTGKYKTDV